MPVVCLQVYAFRPCDGTQTLRKHECNSGLSGPLAKQKSGTIKSDNILKWSRSVETGSKTKKVPTALCERLNKKVEMMCALDFRPLSIAQSSGFQEVAQSLIDIGASHGSVDARTLFNDRTTYSRRLLPKLAEEAQTAISNKIAAQMACMPTCLSPVAFVGDHWTDPFRQVEYTALGIAFVDEKFRLNTFDLCVQEYEGATKHAVNIRSDIMAKLATFIDMESLVRGEEARCVFVSDSDAKLVAALHDFDRLSCAAHDISLAVKAALKAVESTSIGRLIEDSKVLVRYFKKTGLNRNLSVSLKQDVSTRFNSVCIMLHSISESFECVKDELAKHDELKYLTNIKRKLVDGVYKELHRFEVATQKLAVEKEETIHLVVPIYKEMEIKLAQQVKKHNAAGDSDLAILCKHLSSALKEKCTAKLTWYHCAANFLDPVRRNCPETSVSPAERDRVISDIRGLEANFDVHGNLEPPTKKRRRLLSGSESEDEEDTDGQPGNEVDVYLQMKFDTPEFDDVSPLKFWKEQSSKFPKLSTIARSVFAIPATQNKTERSFSAAGNTLTDLRTCLDPEHLRELLLVRSFNKCGQ